MDVCDARCSKQRLARVIAFSALILISLSCLPLMFCTLNLNMWVCVGSLTQKTRGRMPDIDAFSRHGDVADSPSCSVGVNACTGVRVCVRKRMNVKISRGERKKTHYTIQELYNYKINVKSRDCSSSRETGDLSSNLWKVAAAALCVCVQQLLCVCATCWK